MEVMVRKGLGSSLGDKKNRQTSLPKGEAKCSRIQLYIYICYSHETFTPSDEEKGREKKRNVFYWII